MTDEVSAGAHGASWMNPAPVIYVVDDDLSFRTAIADLLAACGYRVALYESAKQLLEKPPASEPACILLDVQMPDLNGPQLQVRLAELGHKLPIVFLTGFGDIPTSVHAIKAGAEDFLTKPVSKDKLLTAIKRALVRAEETREYDSRIAALRSLYSRLTPREREVFALLVRGKPHKQIAYELGTSERTVKLHRHNLMEKCQTRSIADLAVMAERLGLVTPTDATRNGNPISASAQPVR